MKVCIFTEGGRKTGFGHISRCMALAYGIKKIKPKADIEIILRGDNATKDFLGSYNKLIALDWLKEKNGMLPMLKKSELVVVDSYNAPHSFYKFLNMAKPPLRSDRPFVVAIDDYQRINYPVDMVINPSIYGDRLTYKKNTGTIYLLGKDYIILRKEFWQVPKKIIHKNIRRVLIALGGADNSIFLKKILVFLSTSFPGLKYDVVTNYRPTVNVDIDISWYSRASALTMRKLMLRCDLCVSGGGQTLYELIRTGVPTIGVCFIKNQLLSLVANSQNHLVDFAGWATNKDIFVNIKKLIEKNNYENRLILSGKCRKSIKGDGAVVAAKKILDLFIARKI